MTRIRIKVGYNDLWTTHPSVAVKLLDQTLGYKYSKGNNTKVQWICPLKHVWEAQLNNVKGCPYCTGNKVLRGFNDMWTTDPLLATELFNPEDGYIYPKSSNFLLEWVCSKGHTYVKTASERQANQNCPYCSGHRVLIGYNDLWSVRPDIAVELLDQTEGYMYTKGMCKRKLLWRCRKGHIWSSTPNNRTKPLGQGCPSCFNRVSTPERLILRGLNLPYVSQFRDNRFNFVPDIYLPDYNTIIEYDGSYYHKDTVELDSVKTETLLSLGYKVVRVRERNNIKLDKLSIDHPNLLQILADFDLKHTYISDVVSDILDWIDIEER